MKLKLLVPALLILAMPMSAWAASPSSLHEIAPVLDNPEYTPKYFGMKFFFGSQEHPPVAKTFPRLRTIRRAASVGADSEKACQRAFAAGLISLADNAKKQGADAVINIRTAFADKDEASDTQYICGTGALQTGMTLYGDPVKLQ
jgi:hypothetical protein